MRKHDQISTPYKEDLWSVGGSLKRSNAFPTFLTILHGGLPQIGKVKGWRLKVSFFSDRVEKSVS